MGTVSFVDPGTPNIGTGLPTGTTLVGDTNTEIIPPNNFRVAVTLMNRGVHDIWIACDVDAVFGQGNFLGKNGGSLLLDNTVITLGPINGICGTGKESTATFQEFNKK